jgi:hypothetical protein
MAYDRATIIKHSVDCSAYVFIIHREFW